MEKKDKETIKKLEKELQSMNEVMAKNEKLKKDLAKYKDAYQQAERLNSEMKKKNDDLEVQLNDQKQIAESAGKRVRDLVAEKLAATAELQKI